MLLGVANTCILGSAYAFNLSAPAVLQGATHLDATNIGFLVSAVSVLGGVSMVTAGWHSDRRRERHLHVVVSLVILACAFVLMGLSVTPALVVVGYAAFVIFSNAIQAVYFLMPSDILRGRAAAGGIAAIGSIGMVGAFLGPYAWGLAKDYTGDFHAGLFSLAAPHLAAAAIVLVLRSMARAHDTTAFARLTAAKL